MIAAPLPLLAMAASIGFFSNLLEYNTLKNIFFVLENEAANPKFLALRRNPYSILKLNLLQREGKMASPENH